MCLETILGINSERCILNPDVNRRQSSDQNRNWRGSVPDSERFDQKHGFLNSHPTKVWLMKARKPGFLNLKRKYEIDESSWLVQHGRPAMKVLFRKGLPVVKVLVLGGIVSLRFGYSKTKPAFHQGAKISGALRSLGRSFAHEGQMIVWTFEWRRRPKAWEISFVAKMKSMELRGIAFQDVLKRNLPVLFGDAPSEVLLRWMGRKNRTQPKRFAKAAAKMFGKSAKSIITGLENLADPEKMTEVHQDVEPPFQSLIEAIQRADMKAELPIE
jgi:hypothetical protein